MTLTTINLHGVTDIQTMTKTLTTEEGIEFNVTDLLIHQQDGKTTLVQLFHYKGLLIVDKTRSSL